MLKTIPVPSGVVILSHVTHVVIRWFFDGVSFVWGWFRCCRRWRRVLPRRCLLTGGENRLRREWGRWRKGASFPGVAMEEKPLAGKRGSRGGCGSFGLSGSWPQRRRGAVFGPEREKIILWWVAAAWFMRENGFGFFF